MRDKKGGRVRNAVGLAGTAHEASKWVPKSKGKGN